MGTSGLHFSGRPQTGRLYAPRRSLEVKDDACTGCSLSLVASPRNQGKHTWVACQEDVLGSSSRQGGVILRPCKLTCLLMAPLFITVLHPPAALFSTQLTYFSPTNFVDVFLHVHGTYNWSVPGFSIDLEGELAIAMDPLTPAEVGQPLVMRDGVWCQDRRLTWRAPVP